VNPGQGAGCEAVNHTESDRLTFQDPTASCDQSRKINRGRDVQNTSGVCRIAIHFIQGKGDRLSHAKSFPEKNQIATKEITISVAQKPQ
jgi:hypothetical protein